MENLSEVLKDISTRISTQRVSTHTSSSVSTKNSQPLTPAAPIIPPRIRELKHLDPAPAVEQVTPPMPASPKVVAPPAAPSAKQEGELDVPVRQRTAGEVSPDACPQCKGVGWLRMIAPPGSPNFGRIIPCDCKADEINARQKRKLHSISNLDSFSERSFENFDATMPGLREVYSICREYADDPHDWLLLFGNLGCGKTHLAAAIANEAMRVHGLTTYFAVAPDLLDQLRAAYAPSSEAKFDDRFEQIRGASLLVLDDLGTENATSWAKEKLFQIFNHRYNLRLPTVVTTNVDLDSLEPRIRSRLCDVSLCRQVFINAEDYRQNKQRRR